MPEQKHLIFVESCNCEPIAAAGMEVHIQKMDSLRFFGRKNHSGCVNDGFDA